jgi:hypothetical protein
MDTITHGIVGALVGKALFAGRDIPAVSSSKSGESNALSSPSARAAIVACTIGSTFPDIDIFAGPLAHNPLAIMEWHRNITHSALILPIWALLLAALSLPLARWLEMEIAAIPHPIRNLRGGYRHAHFPGSGHQLWNYGLEPAAVFQTDLGLGFHHRSHTDLNRPRSAAGCMVLPRAGTILEP